MTNRVLCGDCVEVLGGLDGESVDCCVTDPPYGLSFMGKGWDYSVPSVDQWREVYRVLKPGAFLLSFFGTRTYHRGVVAIEDAGFEIRDQIGWVYGSGFPKSLDVGKAIDKVSGNSREIVGSKITKDIRRSVEKDIEAGKTDRQGKFAPGSPTQYMKYIETRGNSQWEGWGTALKPAWEPICVARKPLIGTVAENVLKYGTGGVNIDGCRVSPTGERLGGGGEKRATFDKKEGWSRPWMSDPTHAISHAEKVRENVERATTLARFPANLIHDGSDEVLALFPDSKSTGGANGGKLGNRVYGKFENKTLGTNAGGLGDSGSASRFFYCAKASRSERGEGNTHPTVKPLKLMEYLIKLVCPPGGVVLDPFLGSGTTALAAKRMGTRFIGIELNPEYCKIAEDRLARETVQMRIG